MHAPDHLAAELKGLDTALVLPHQLQHLHGQAHVQAASSKHHASLELCMVRAGMLWKERTQMRPDAGACTAPAFAESIMPVHSVCGEHCA